MKSESVKSTVDLPVDLHAKAKALAKASGVSFQQYAVAALRESVAAEKRVVVAFEVQAPIEPLKQAANFSERVGQPDIDK